MTATDIFCGNCGTTATVNKVTAGIRCRCGAGIEHIGALGVDPMPAHLAYPHGPGTGWGVPQDLTRGWSSYEGPPVGPNPKGVSVADNMTCPTCHGAGYDVIDHSICRECGGSGKVTATTAQPAVGQYDSHQGPPVGGARHAGRPSKADPHGTADYQNAAGGGDYRGWGAPSKDFNPDDKSTFYPKYEGQSPSVKVRQDRDYSQGSERPHQLNEASCPECGHAPTQLLKTPEDRYGNADAIWHCPNCGPLVNIDKHPKIDPYRPVETGYVKPDRNALKTSRLAGLAEVKRTGKLLPLISAVQEHNTVSLRESLDLARAALLAYPEGRS